MPHAGACCVSSWAVGRAMSQAASTSVGRGQCSDAPLMLSFWEAAAVFTLEPAVCSTACPLQLGVLPGWPSLMQAGCMPLRPSSLHHNCMLGRGPALHSICRQQEQLPTTSLLRFQTPDTHAPAAGGNTFCSRGTHSSTSCNESAESP